MALPNGRTWRRGGFQNAVGGGERRSSAFLQGKGGNAREREGRLEVHARLDMVEELN